MRYRHTFSYSLTYYSAKHAKLAKSNATASSHSAHDAGLSTSTVSTPNARRRNPRSHQKTVLPSWKRFSTGSNGLRIPSRRMGFQVICNRNSSVARQQQSTVQRSRRHNRWRHQRQMEMIMLVRHRCLFIRAVLLAPLEDIKVCTFF